jgi:hypothetical protein
MAFCTLIEVLRPQIFSIETSPADTPAPFEPETPPRTMP